MFAASMPEFGTWEFLQLRQGSCAEPAGLPSGGWLPARAVPIAALPCPEVGGWTAAALEESEFWYRGTLLPDGPGVLRCDGLATIADVWNRRQMRATIRQHVSAPRCCLAGDGQRAAYPAFLLSQHANCLARSEDGPCSLASSAGQLAGSADGSHVVAGANAGMVSAAPLCRAMAANRLAA